MNSRIWRKPTRIFLTLFLLGLLTTAVTAVQSDAQEVGPESQSAVLLRNRGFENSSGPDPDHWHTYQPHSEPTATFVWDDKTAHSGSHSVKVSSASLTVGRWVQRVEVEIDTLYELSGWIRTEDVQGLYGGKAKLAVFGPWGSELAASTRDETGTSDWHYVSVQFITGNDSAVDVVCTLGDNDSLFRDVGDWERSTGTVWCDDLQLTKIRNLERTIVQGDHVRLDIYTEIYDLFDDAETYVRNLDEMHEAMEELVGDVPSDGGMYTIRTDATMYYGGLSGNPIRIPPNDSWPNAVNFNRGTDFAIPHELGHNFDIAPYYNQYATALPFGCTEFWANLKLVYAFEVVGARHPGMRATTWNGARGNQDVVPIEELGAWSADNNGRPWVDAGRTDYENMTVDDYVGLNYMLVQQIGWEPFKKAFRAYRPVKWDRYAPDLDKVEVWANLLSQFAGVDLVPQFRQWGFPINSPTLPSVFISANRAHEVNGINYAPGDILHQDESGSWSLFFDASDVGIPSAVDLHSFTFRDDGIILLTFDKTINLPGAGQVRPWDVVGFIPSQLGPDTAGTFIPLFRGSNAGLNYGNSGEKIDAIAWNDSYLFVSTEGKAVVPDWEGTIVALDEDVLEFEPDLWTGTFGDWREWIDGSTIPGLEPEDIASLAVEDRFQRSIYISVKDKFSIAGTSGNEKDIVHLYKCGDAMCAEIVWHGPENAFLSAVDGLYVGQAPPVPEESSITVCLSSSPADDTPIRFEGDLGEFTLRDPRSSCFYATYQNPGSYNVTPILPADWHIDLDYSDCDETSDNDLSLWQIASDALTIDLAGGTGVSCTFETLYHPGEPNDSMEMASAILFDETFEALIGAHDDVYWYDDEDYYTFNGLAGDKITVDIVPSGNLNAWLSLRDSTGTVLHEVETWDAAHLEYELLAGGEYYLVVTGSCGISGDGCDGPYTLTFATRKKTWTLYIPVAGAQ